MSLQRFAAIATLLLFFSCKTKQKVNYETVKKDFLEEQKQKCSPASLYFNENFYTLHTLNQEKFTAAIDSLKSVYTTHLTSYKGKLDAATYKEEDLAINLSFDRFILEYPQIHKNFTGNQVILHQKNEQRIKNNEVHFNDAITIKNEYIGRYIQSYIAFLTSKELETQKYKGKDNQQLTADWNQINTLFESEEIKSFWKYTYLYNHIDNYGIKNIETFYEDFIAASQNSSHLENLNRIYKNHQNARDNHLIKTYKTVDGFDLDIHLFIPEDSKTTQPKPTIVYFHGGSWSLGKPDWFFETGKQYATNGWVAAAVEYRIKGRHGNYPFASVKDAKSAIRWLRANANKYGIDPEKIIATGNSAGGHLSIAAALTTTFNESTDDTEFSPVPNVVIANAAVYDLTVRNSQWISEQLNDKSIVHEISPNSLIKKTSTKFLLIHGENDRRCEYSTAQYFYEQMKKLGNTVELHKIEDSNHFIWYNQHAPKVYQLTNKYIDELNF